MSIAAAFTAPPESAAVSLVYEQKPDQRPGQIVRAVQTLPVGLDKKYSIRTEPGDRGGVIITKDAVNRTPQPGHLRKSKKRGSREPGHTP
jgi:hypothetical protein